MNVHVYGKVDCVHCTRAKEFLAKNSIPFVYYDTQQSHLTMEELVQRLGYYPKTVPQIFIGKRHVGGCDDLVALPLSLIQQMVGGS
jgi:glutaredoxin 3